MDIRHFYMNDLEYYFRHNNKRLIHKWEHYFDIYETHFSRFRGKEVHILEIGVSQGGSLQMWKSYFGDKAKIYGLDINPACKELEEENIQIFIGSQSDRQFLRQLKSQIPPLDILLDDGGHTMIQQIVTYEELFDHVKDDGVFMCEDLHTSYLLMYGGGYKRRGTFIEYSKDFIDQLNAFHSEQPGLRPSLFTKHVKSVHYYDGVIVLEKGNRPQKYLSEKTGERSFPALTPAQEAKQSTAFYRFKMGTLAMINRVLRAFRLPGFIWR